ncbi:beta-N-acetylhexosaminidase [Altererythrobacter aquiaggeris]|uniref:beta-N-acetylhexosaminidase n=1 Tax=Aestuarierythrobacter aquiaggeris TaxID=1898396 RepID=UPI0030195E84
MTPAIFGIAGPALSADERDFFRDARPAGYILFGRNCETREQLRALTDSLRNLHGCDRLLISIDQEGGRVARMRPPEWSQFPAGEIFDNLYQIAPASAIEAARVNSEAMGLELAEAGITVDYHAPFDVRRPETDAAIGDRALGSTPMQVAALGRAVLDGLARSGVIGCLKHMPGHGRATADSHYDLPVVDASAADLEADIEPFRALSGAAIGMSAHIRYTAWDADNPATLSPFVIDEIIRGKIGFDGLLLTDDIDMQALNGTVPERAVLALAAGCDIVLNCWAKIADMEGIVRSCPQISARARERLDAAMNSVSAAEPSDIGELLAKRDALLAAAGVSA